MKNSASSSQNTEKEYKSLCTRSIRRQDSAGGV